MAEEETKPPIEYVKVDTLKPRARNVNVIVKVFPHREQSKRF